MCGTCGCDEDTSRTVVLEQQVLAKNDGLATENRDLLRAKRIALINLMSSPGSGKTSLLARTAREFSGAPVAVVEGDQETGLDAARLRDSGCPVVQINTGTGCHLDATMLADGLRALEPPNGSVVFVENVGNLVCPALFDLGESARVVLASVTEGEDKPLKYPHMFSSANLVLLNKIDLLPHLDFDVDRFVEAATKVNPHAQVRQLSVSTGKGLDDWYTWLATQDVSEP
ncbi:hydrogenase nickel incorporation protein HypB [Saccharopolyspora sp. NPDC002376]